MTAHDIELSAKNGTDIKIYSPLDNLLHILFCDLYADYRRGNISVQQASEKKRVILQQYNLLDKELTDAHSLSEKYADNILKTDGAVSELCKQSAKPEVSDTDLLIKACQIIDAMLGGAVITPTMTKHRKQ